MLREAQNLLGEKSKKKQVPRANTALGMTICDFSAS